MTCETPFVPTLSTNTSVGVALVQSTQLVHTTELTEEQRENQLSSKFPDMCNGLFFARFILLFIYVCLCMLVCD